MSSDGVLTEWRLIGAGGWPGRVIAHVPESWVAQLRTVVVDHGYGELGSDGLAQFDLGRMDDMSRFVRTLIDMVRSGEYNDISNAYEAIQALEQEQVTRNRDGGFGHVSQ
ncbi:MAG: hypothetical protein FWF43_01120 [Propionibacteriaceae bacterium]|nr:hypothetical protein [Propionibacteriaceae bacterium]